MYKVTLCITQEEILDYKKRGRWPLKINGYEFDESTEYSVEDLSAFAANKKHPLIDGVLFTDPRLKIEVLDANSTETDRPD